MTTTDNQKNSSVRTTSGDESGVSEGTLGDKDPKSDGWLYTLKDSRLFSAVVAAVTTLMAAGLLYVGNSYMKQAEMTTRTYELMSSRETAAQTLQAQVFEAFLEHVVPVIDEGGGRASDYKKVAVLAGLHSNFSEVFDTRPVFAAFSAIIQDPGARNELVRLAKRVARHQAEFIRAHPGSDLHPITENSEQSLGWPDNSKTPSFLLWNHNMRIGLKGSAYRRYDNLTSQTLIGDNAALEDDDDDRIDDVADYVTIEVFFDSAENPSEAKDDPYATFTVSYMDTPYMDTLWLEAAPNVFHQISLRLLDIDTVDGQETTDTVEIELIHFPADLFRPTERLPLNEMLQGGHVHSASDMTMDMNAETTQPE